MSFSENLILGQHGWFDNDKFKEYSNIHPHKGGARFRYSGLQKNFSFFITNLSFRIYQYDNSAGNATFYITDTNTSKITDSYIGTSLIIKTNGAGTWNNFDLSPLLEDENIKNLLNSGDDFYIHMLTEADIGFYRTGTKTITLTVDWVYGYSSGTISNSQLNLNTIQTLNISPVDSSYSHEVIWQIQTIDGDYVQCGDTQFIAAGTKIATTDIYTGNDYFSDAYFKTTEKITKGKAILITKNSSGDSLGSVEISFDIVIPDSLGAPNINLEIKPQVFGNDPEGVFSESGLYVVNRTKIVWKGNAEFQGNATFSSCELIYSGGLTGTEEIDSDSLNTDKEGKVITNSSLITCTLKITDSRGFSASMEQTITPTVYNKPTVYFSYAKRTDSSWNEQPVSGKNALLKVSISYTSLNNKNSIKLVSYKGQEVNNPLITYDPTSSNSSQAEFSNLSENEIKFTVNVQDKATGESVFNYVSIPAAFYILHIPKGGRGIGIGSVAENNYINCGWTLDLQKGFKIDNLDFSSITSEEEFQTVIGGPFLPIAGGSITGIIQLSNSASLQTSDEYLLVGYDITNGSRLGSHGNTTTICGSNLLKHYDGTKNYDIATIGKNIIYAAADANGNPSEITPTEGMIWFCPID